MVMLAVTQKYDEIYRTLCVKFRGLRLVRYQFGWDNILPRVRAWWKRVSMRADLCHSLLSSALLLCHVPLRRLLLLLPSSTPPPRHFSLPACSYKAILRFSRSSSSLISPLLFLSRLLPSVPTPPHLPPQQQASKTQQQASALNNPAHIPPPAPAAPDPPCRPGGPC